jgi:cytochrome c5
MMQFPAVHIWNRLRVCTLRGSASVLFLALFMVWAESAPAEMSGSDYQSQAARLSEEERERMRAQLAEEIEAERARAAEADRRARAEAEALAAARAARPLGERLTEDRCGSCHDPAELTAVRHGWLGWNATILRMSWINGASLQRGERQVIAGHLAARSAGGRSQALLEWGILAAASSAIFVLLRFLARRRARRIRDGA